MYFITLALIWYMYEHCTHDIVHLYPYRHIQVYTHIYIHTPNVGI